MIAIAKAIKGSLKGVRYGNDESKLFTDTNGNVCQGTFNLTSNNPEENWMEMKTIANLSKIKSPFVTAVLSPTAEESRLMKYEDWKEMAVNYAKEFGFHDNQWRWDVHGNTDEKHLHIYANRINFSGKNSVKEARIGIRSGEWAARFAKSKGWKTLDEISLEKKIKIKSVLQESLKVATNFDHLKSEMEKRGYTFQLSFSTKNEDKTLNGMRIMTLSDAEKREKRQIATDLAVSLGKVLLPKEVRNQPKLSFIELELAKELGINELPKDLRELVLTKAEIKAKPGFTLTELDKDKTTRLKIGEIVSVMDKNTNILGQRTDEIRFGREFHKNSIKSSLQEALDILLKHSYNEPARDDWFKKRKKRRK